MSTESRIIDVCKHVVRMTTQAGSGHPSSALSLAHLVAALMYEEMRYEPENPWNPASDRLVLSEGHSVPIVYAAYADLGGAVGRSPEQKRNLTLDDLGSLREWDSELDGHPNPAEGFPFFDAATGSLGQGLSVGAGLGLAAQLNKSNKRIFVLIGDGESREGQIWEALDFIMDKKLTHVVPIFNCNGQGQADYVSDQQSADVMEKKLQAFGYKVAKIDGHNLDEIRKTLKEVGQGDQPMAIVAQTTKGWGVDDLKAHTNHGKPLPEDAVEAAETSLDKTAKELNIVDDGKKPTPKAPESFNGLKKNGNVSIEPFADALQKAGMADAVESKKKLSTRKAYGVALAALGRADERIVSLDGDVSNSTFSKVFAGEFPDRFFECKIAEQNMISAAAGLYAGGMIPFASSFAKFLARGYDQLEMAAITRANINLVGSHAGVSLGADGPSQMSLPDMAYFRSYTKADDGRGNPAATVFHPSDAVSCYKLTELAANTQNLCYLRVHRPEVPLLYDYNESFEVGGCKQLTEGDKLTIVSSGYMVHVVMQALKELEEAGIKCNLFDAYCLPLNTDPIFAAAEKTNNTVLSVEDNFTGGIGSALAEDAAEQANARVLSMTCPRIPKSGKTGDIILEHLGLGPQDVVKKVKSLVG